MKKMIYFAPNRLVSVAEKMAHRDYDYLLCPSSGKMQKIRNIKIDLQRD